jgi:hypothetical protein
MFRLGDEMKTDFVRGRQRSETKCATVQRREETGRGVGEKRQDATARYGQCETGGYHSGVQSKKSVQP